MTPFVVIRCSDLEKSAAFYSSLGLTLTPEKHGNGPSHFSIETSGVVIELYPANGKGATTNLMIGIDAVQGKSIDPDGNILLGQ